MEMERITCVHVCHGSMEVHKRLQIRHQRVCQIGVMDTEFLYNIVFHHTGILDSATNDAITKD